MKLKFRAEAKDWAMFGVYCVVLLFFVAIALLNVVQFAKGDLDHPFYGLNPFPAFGPDYIGLSLKWKRALVFLLRELRIKKVIQDGLLIVR